MIRIILCSIELYTGGVDEEKVCSFSKYSNRYDM